MKDNQPESADAGDIHLGTLLGRRQAFGLIAARCSAADAACLREIRNQKSYKKLAKDWSQFCSQHLGLSHTHANRIIRYLDEFGPEYFALAQLTGIPVEAYRAIAPAVKEQALHCGGQAIALLPENTEALVKAVEKLRGAAARKPAQPPMEERITRIDRRLAQLAAEIREISCTAPRASLAHMQLWSVLKAASERLQRIELELGPLA